MRYAKLSILLCAALMVAGCGPVEWLNPAFTDADLIFEPALVGAWQPPGNDQCILRFSKTGDRSYEVIDFEADSRGGKPDETRYDGSLAKLGDSLFLDLLPETSRVKSGSYAFTLTELGVETALHSPLAEVGDGLYASLAADEQEQNSGGGVYHVRLAQAHWLLHVRLDGDRLQLADLDEDWFAKALASGKIGVGFERVNDTLVITAPTEQLRSFLLEFGEDNGAFPREDETEFHRQE